MSRPRFIFNQKNEQEVDLIINGEIDSWWGTGLAEVNQMLANSGASKINLQINSPGGSVTEGLAIAGLIKNFPAEINTTIIGFAASIATPIALAGNTVSIDRDSFFMIHNPWSFAGGEADDLRETADLLDKTKAQLAEIYVAKIKESGKLISGRTDSTLKQVNEWMDNETWFTAQEAFEAGLVDRVIDKKKKTDEENAKSILNSCKNFKNAPVEFLNKFQTIVDMSKEKETVDATDNQATIWESVKAFFKSNPAEVKDLISQVEKENAENEEAEIAKAKEIAKANGFYLDPSPSTEEEEEEGSNELEEAQKQLDAQAKELKELKASLNAFEKKHAAPSAGDGGETSEKQEKITIENLIKKDKDAKGFFERLGKNLNV